MLSRVPVVRNKPLDSRPGRPIAPRSQLGEVGSRQRADVLVQVAVGLVEQRQQVRRLGLHLELRLAVPLGGDLPECADHLPLRAQRVRDQHRDRVGLGQRAPVERPVVHAAYLLAHLGVDIAIQRTHRLGDALGGGLFHQTFSVTRYSRYRPNSNRVWASSAGNTLSTIPTIGYMKYSRQISTFLAMGQSAGLGGSMRISR